MLKDWMGQTLKAIINMVELMISLGFSFGGLRRDISVQHDV